MAEQERIFLTRLTIRNLQRITAASWDLRPGLLRLTSGGKNKQGKTSVLRAVRMLFEGAGAVPDVARHKDAAEDDKAFVEGCLSNGWTITRNVTPAGKAYLKVVGPGGLEGKQGHINEWRGNAVEDPMAFYGLSPEDQAERFLAMADDPELKAKLDANAAKEKRLRDERTPVISDQRRLRAVPGPKGERPDPVDTSAELARLRELQAVERERNDLVREYHDERREAARECERERQEAMAHLESAKASRHSNANAQQEALGRIEELRRQLAAAKERLELLESQGKELDADIEEAKEVVHALPSPNEAAEAVPEPELPPDPSEDIAAVQARLEQADAIQRQLEPWKEYERAQDELEVVEKRKKELDEAIKKAQAERTELIAAASFPIEGLDLSTDGALLMNGLPVSQASGRERAELALHAAIYDNPKLRIILIDEGSDIDAEGLERIGEFCVENELQLILARIGLEGPGELEIIDGKGGGELAREEEAEEEPESD